MLERQGHRLSKPERSGGVWLRAQVPSGLSSTGGGTVLGGALPLPIRASLRGGPGTGKDHSRGLS